MIPLITVQSTAIAAHGYDPSTSTLAIRFTGGDKVHHYRDVPADIAEGLASAESAGRFYAQHIRGRFDAATLNEET